MITTTTTMTDDHGARRDPERRRGTRWCTTRSGRLPRRPGYDDAERWWDDSSSRRLDGSSPFPMITEAMAELRAVDDRRGPSASCAARRTCGRPSAPRSSAAVQPGGGGLRCLARPGAGRAAAPARPGREDPAGHAQAQGPADLGALDPRAAGQRAPATARASPRPGWYHHLWTAPDQPIARWLTKVARALRDQGPAGLQRARDRGGPAGRDAGRACAAGRWPGWPRSPTRPGPCSATATNWPSRFVTDHLVVGQALGSVDARRADGAAGGRSGRDLPDACGSGASRCRGSHDLDLRQPHRPGQVPAVPPAPAARRWTGSSRPRATVQGQGTFRETWAVAAGEPEFAVALVEAAVWGTTVESAATAEWPGSRQQRQPARADRVGRTLPARRTARGAGSAAAGPGRPGRARRRRRAPDGRAAAAGPGAALRRRPRHRHLRAAPGRRGAGRADLRRPAAGGRRPGRRTARPPCAAGSTGSAARSDC